MTATLTKEEKIFANSLKENELVSEEQLDQARTIKEEIRKSTGFDVKLSEILVQNEWVQEKKLKVLQDVLREKFGQSKHFSKFTNLFPPRFEQSELESEVLEDLLLENHYISPRTYENILQLKYELESKGIHKPMGELLLETGHISKAQIQQLTANQGSNKDSANKEQTSSDSNTALEENNDVESESATPSTETPPSVTQDLPEFEFEGDSLSFEQQKKKLLPVYRQFLEELIDKNLIEEQEKDRVISIYQDLTQTETTSLGTLCLQEEVLQKEELKEALSIQKNVFDRGIYKPLGEILIEKDYLSRETVLHLLEKQRSRIQGTLHEEDQPKEFPFIEELVTEIDRKLIDRIVDEDILNENDIPTVLQTLLRKKRLGKDVYKIGELAVIHNFLTQSQLEEALEDQKWLKQKDLYKPLAEILVEKGYMEVEEIEALLEIQKNINNQLNQDVSIPEVESSPITEGKGEEKSEHEKPAGKPDGDEEKDSVQQSDEPQPSPEKSSPVSQIDWDASVDEKESSQSIFRFLFLPALLGTGFLATWGIWTFWKNQEPSRGNRFTLDRQIQEKSEDPSTTSRSSSPAYKNWEDPPPLPERQSRNSLYTPLTEETFPRFKRLMSIYLLLDRDPSHILFRIPPEERTTLMEETLNSLWNDYHQNLVLRSGKLPGFRMLEDPSATHVHNPWIPVLTRISTNASRSPYVRFFALKQLRKIISREFLRKSRDDLFPLPSLPVQQIARTSSIKTVLNTLLKGIGNQNPRFIRREAGNTLKQLILQSPGEGRPFGSLWGTFLLRERLPPKQWKNAGVSTNKTRNALHKLRENLSGRISGSKELKSIFFSLKRTAVEARKIRKIFKESLKTKKRSPLLFASFMAGFPGWEHSIHDKYFLPMIQEAFSMVKKKGIAEMKAALLSCLQYAFLRKNKQLYRKIRPALFQLQNRNQYGHEVFSLFGDWTLYKTTERKDLPLKQDLPYFPYLHYFPRDARQTSNSLLTSWNDQSQNASFPAKKQLFALRTQLLINPSTNFSVQKLIKVLARKRKTKELQLLLRYLNLKELSRKELNQHVKFYVKSKFSPAAFPPFLSTATMLGESRSRGTFQKIWSSTENLLSNHPEKKIPLKKLQKRLLEDFLLCFPARAEQFIAQHTEQLPWTNNYLLKKIKNYGMISVAAQMIQNSKKNSLSTNQDPSYKRFIQRLTRNVFQFQYRRAKNKMNKMHPNKSDNQNLTFQMFRPGSWLEKKDQWHDQLNWALKKKQTNPSRTIRFLMRYLLHPLESKNLFSLPDPPTSKDPSSAESVFTQLKEDRYRLSYLFQQHPQSPVDLQKTGQGSIITLKKGEPYPGLDARSSVPSLQIQRNVEWTLKGDKSHSLQADLIQVKTHPLNPGSTWKLFNLQLK